MIVYTARTWQGQQLTVVCPSREAALDLAEGDLLNGIVPVMLEVCGVQLNTHYIYRLLVRRRTRAHINGALASA